MKAVIVRGAGQTPVYGEFADPTLSLDETFIDETVITVTGAAINHLTKARASGTHYSSSGTFPFVVGVDGVGRLGDGQRVYFVLPRAPHGSMAERTMVPSGQCVRIPDALDDVTAAAIANPGMSSWAALTERAKLKAGETVLVNGATGVSGRLAVQIAKHLGARKVIATGRDAESLRSLAALGADVTISLVEGDKALEAHFMEQFSAGIDVVIDYLWGKSAESLLLAGAKAAPQRVPVRFVQVGSVTGANVMLPSAVLRSSTIEMMGSGLGSVPLERLVKAIDGVLQATVSGGFKIATKPIPLAEVERVWHADDSARRIVLTVGA